MAPLTAVVQSISSAIDRRGLAEEGGSQATADDAFFKCIEDLDAIVAQGESSEVKKLHQVMMKARQCFQVGKQQGEADAAIKAVLREATQVQDLT